MTLRMAKRIRMEDIERVLGECGVEGAWFRERWPEGIDLTTAEGMAAVQEMHDRGFKLEFGLAVVLDEEQRKRYIGELVDERKALLGVTTQEEVAQEVLSSDEERRQVAYEIMVDLGTAGRPRDLVLALRATERARVALGDGDVKGVRDRGLVWFQQEITDAVRDGRVKERVH